MGGWFSYPGLAEVGRGDPGARPILCRAEGGKMLHGLPLPEPLGERVAVADAAPLAGARCQTAFALADFSGKQM